MLKRIAVRLREWLGHRHLAWHLALLAMLLCAPSLWLGLQMDDYIHRAALTGGTGFTELSRSPARLFAFITGDREANRQAVAAGFNPWWAHDDLRLAFFRPLTGLTHWIDYTLWPRWPALMHLHSLVWYAGVVVAATLLFRRMLRPAWVAGLAAMLFAVDDAHGLPVLWLANRNATIGVLFGLLTLLAHDRWRREGWRLGAFLAPLLLLLGLLSNEGALATAAYLFAYALFLDPGTWPKRLQSLVPCALVGIAWLVAYGQMGYGAVGSGMYIDPGATPLRFLRALAERGPILLLGQWLVASDLCFSMSLRLAHAMWFVALGFLAVLAVILAPLLKRDAVARFWLTGMLISVPVFCTVYPTDRLLFFVGIGGMGLLAQLIAAVLERADWLPTWAWWRRLARTLCYVFICVHLLMAPVALMTATAYIKILGGVLSRAAASLPNDPEVSGQTVLIVNTPTHFVSVFGPLLHATNGQPTPARTFVLGSGIHSTEVTRPDARTLLIRPAGGFLAAPGSPEPGREAQQPWWGQTYGFPAFDRLFRDETPMRVGQRIKLEGVGVEITAVTADGRPAEAAFRFPTPLEDPSLRWLQWDDGVYAPFGLPAVGESVTLPPRKGTALVAAVVYRRSPHYHHSCESPRTLACSPLLAATGDRSMGPASRLVLSVAILAMASGGFFGCDRQPTTEKGTNEAGRLRTGQSKPNVILIVMDALRADRLGAYGHQGNLAPTMDAIAREGVTFEHCVSASPWTLPSVATLFVSYYPGVHQTVVYRAAPQVSADEPTFQSVLSDEFSTLAEVFKANGYQTAGFCANKLIRQPYGFAQGFDHFDTSFAGDTVRGDMVTAAALKWLAEHRDADKPLLLYLHYMDVHGPYDAAPRFMDPLMEAVEAKVDKHALSATEWSALDPYLKRPPPETSDATRYERLRGFREYWAARYDAGVAEGDFYIGQLVQRLREADLWDDAYVILTADHGEAFCEHGFWDHGYSQHQTDLHVPLILRWPHVLPAGKRVAQLAGLIDLLPTLTDQLRLPAIESWQGTSLVPHIQGQTFDGPLTRLAEADKFNYRQAFFMDELKLMVTLPGREWRPDGTPAEHAAEVQLYDLAEDPGETNNLARKMPERTAQLLKMLKRAIRDGRDIKPGLVARQNPVESEMVHRLRTLGYTGDLPDDEEEQDQPPESRPTVP